uniref:Putative sulfotransferase domain contining protein n=1 Tax=viral metagenome TaxID=1070528 RepID=A0A6M3L8Z6_9ZZZZ
MKQLAIAILCHWRSGSSLTAMILNACGMHTGNEATGWLEERDKNQCEHGVLNTVGNHLFHAGYDESYLSKVAPILDAYKVQGWPCFGVKFTHVLQEKCWRYLGPIFKACWPDAKYVICIRNPAEIIKNLAAQDITPDAIIESWMSTYDATKELIDEKGAIVIAYPDSFTNGHIQHVVKELGLTWTDKAEALFDPDMVDDTTGVPEDSKGFAEAVAMYEEFKKYAVIPEPPEVITTRITTPSRTFQLQDEERLKATMDEIAKITVDKLSPAYKRTDSVRTVRPSNPKKRRT